MSKEELYIKGPLAVIATFSTYMLGTFNELLVVFVAVMVLDIFTGLLRAILTKSLNSTIGLKGIFGKITMILVIGLTACVQFVLHQLGLETSNFLVVGVLCFFIVNEGISILENSAQLGVPLPAVIFNALEKLQEIGGKEQVVEKVAKKLEEKDQSEEDE